MDTHWNADGDDADGSNDGDGGDDDEGCDESDSGGHRGVDGDHLVMSWIQPSEAEI